MDGLNILTLSTDLQSELIKSLVAGVGLPALLAQVVDVVEEVLQADGGSIFLVEDSADPNGHQQAFMKAGIGYQKQFVGKAQCKVVPPALVSDEPTREEMLGLTGWVISTGRSFLARSPDELEKHPHWLGRYDRKQVSGEELRLQTFLSVPLRNLRGQVIGTLKAERREGKESFKEHDQIVLETLARVAGRCAAYVDDIQRPPSNTLTPLEDRLNAAITSWTLDLIAEAVATEGELDAFLDIIVKAIASATGADSCAIFLIDENKEPLTQKALTQKTLTQRAGCGSQVLRRVIRAYKLPDESQVADCLGVRACDPLDCENHELAHIGEKVGLTAWVAATGKSFHARSLEELKKHCHHRGEYDKQNYEDNEQCGAWLGVPLQVGGTITGVLKIENVARKDAADDRDFAQAARRRLDVLAPEVALAIKRVQWQSPIRYQVIEKAMPKISEILRGGLEVGPLVQRVVEETAKLFNARASALFLKEGSQLIQPEWAAFGWARRGPKVRKYDLVPRDQILDDPTLDQPKVGLTVWIAGMRVKFTAKSHLQLIAHPHHKGVYDKVNFEEREQCESFMGAPLLVGDELVGVLKVETKMRGEGENREFAYFSEQDELVFSLISDSAAIAIQNARLLEARRLADRVLAQPDVNAVLGELYKFIRGRVEVVSTLHSTAQIVRGAIRERGEVVQGFAALLEPDFNIAIVQQLARQADDPVRGLMRFFVAAIQARTLNEVLALSELGFSEDTADELPIATLLQPGYFLRECTETLFDTLRHVEEFLRDFDEDRTQRVALEKSLQLLEDTKSRLDQMNLFEVGVLGRIFTNWHDVIAETFREPVEIRSPYVVGPPLDPDSPVFVGREDVFHWIEDRLSQSQKNALVLHGMWRTGKTSILKQLEAGPLGRRVRERRRRPLLPVFVDVYGIADSGTGLFLLGIADAVSDAFRARGMPVHEPDEQEFVSFPYRAFNRFLQDAGKLLKAQGNGVLVIMLDEFEKLDERVREGKVETDIFTFLRSQMQHQPAVTFILAGRHRLDEMTSEFKNILFNVAQHKEIGFLSPAEAERLIRDPVRPVAVTYEDSVVERVYELTAGHPFLIQQLCDHCIAALNEQKSGYEIRAEHLERSIELALDQGSDSALEQLWDSIGETGQKILEGLAQSTSNRQPWSGEDDIFNQAIRSSLNEADVNAACQMLEAQRLLVGDPALDQATTRYRFKFDLLRLWVLRRVTEVR